jgi:hypothetical protein
MKTALSLFFVASLANKISCKDVFLFFWLIPCFPRNLNIFVKRPGREANHSSPSSAVKECVELYLHFPTTSSWRDA